MARARTKGCLAAIIATASLGTAIVTAVANEIYFKPLGEKIAARWGCLADVDGCLRTLNTFLLNYVWLCLAFVFGLGMVAGALLSSRLRLQGIRLGRRLHRKRKLGRHENALLIAAKQAPNHRLFVRRNEVPPTVNAGEVVFGGAADRGSALAWIAAVDILSELGYLRDPFGRGEVYDLMSLRRDDGSD